ncbi:hypothetical protein H490_0112080 [Leucobacter sp. UCD-THU]|uniref:hypothetical protein n=1 Tax=Leucobacter sp. UCD-THU TaxID=1292023 RepID=UPI000374299D|nr:hypothetical protein [Leucobacter sp. UCD-THU]EYT52752.1 hypothetical protein H490_0112080 [Leucobacter sp. UCD-THU]
MTGGDGEADPAARLALFRSEWPRRVSWREVRAADPTVFRSAARGAVVVMTAVPLTLLASCLTLEVPVAIPLPDWLDWSRGLLMMVLIWASIGFWIWGLVLLSLPADTRRGIAFARFAAERDLGYSRFGFPPERLGILLAEGRTAPRSRRLRDAAAADPAAASLFSADFAIWRSEAGRGRPVARRPAFQIAVARYTGGKSDPKGPRSAFRVLEMPLPRVLPHLMIDSRRNGRLRSFLPGVQRLSLEGDFDRYFAVYAPEGYARDALELLTPDVMVCLLDHGRRWDIEVVEDRLVVASHRFRAASDRAEVTAMLLFSELVARELGHQAGHYTDPRADRPRTQVAAAGRRLRRRSAAWSTAALALAVAVMLGFPHLLGWWLDRS